MKNRTNPLVLAIAAGAALSAGNAALAQPRLINISGATLLENYVRGPASTNDFIDVDGNGVAGSLGSPIPQQLAPSGIAPPYAAGHVWTVQYRAVGSVNGFIELAKFGRPNVVTTNDADVNGILGNRPNDNPPVRGVASTAYNNRVAYIQSGNRTGAYNAGNPGGAPNRADLASNYAVTYALPDTGSTGGIQIDIAPIDVAAVWAVRKGVEPAANWRRRPFDNGYGFNTRLSVNQAGGTTGFTAGLSAELPDALGRNFFDPSNPGAADQNTIFDTNLALAPIAPVVNYGTGIQQVTMTELQHLFGTGRARTGENFMVVTRDVGSGTRNAFQNSIGQDPSWGVGDSVGGGGTPPVPSTIAAEFNLGAQFVPANKGSNGAVESTLRNARLGVGYVGTERGVTGSGSGSWLTTKALEIANVRNDIYGGTAFVRPTVNNILDNNANGWVIGGQAVLSSIGDPRAEPVAAGGQGLSTPAMTNKAAAAYLNNISRSIAAFTALPGGAQSDFMPGELAAFQFLLLAAVDNIHPLTDPATLVANPDLNQPLQDYTRANNIHTNPLFASFDNTVAGRVPTRTTLTGGASYSDGVANGTNYITQGGAAVAYGSVLTLRNKIAYDFNGDSTRSIADAADMIRAWRQRNGGPVWAAPAGAGGSAGPGSDAIIEVLGDGNGDGSFTSADVRLWADGFALNASGNVDRKLGFTTVDQQSLAVGGPANFFGTTLATTKPYAAGDARGDVFNAAGNVARGWAPVGADGAVDCNDIEYVYRQFKAQKNPGITDGAANWSNLDEAVYFDLSADMNGDLKVDQDDVTEVIQTILGTVYGDVNFDGVRDAADSALITTNFNTLPATYCRGDINGDGVINSSDIGFTPGPSCRIDFNNNGTREPADIFAFLTAYFAPTTPVAQIDFNCNTTREPADIFAFLTKYFANDCAGCP